MGKEGYFSPPRYYTREGVNRVTVGRIIRRIGQDMPPEIDDKVAGRIRSTEDKHINDLNGVHRALADMLAVFRAKLAGPVK